MYKYTLREISNVNKQIYTNWFIMRVVMTTLYIYIYIYMS